MREWLGTWHRAVHRRCYPVPLLPPLLCLIAGILPVGLWSVHEWPGSSALVLGVALGAAAGLLLPVERRWALALFGVGVLLALTFACHWSPGRLRWVAGLPRWEFVPHYTRVAQPGDRLEVEVSDGAPDARVRGGYAVGPGEVIAVLRGREPDLERLPARGRVWGAGGMTVVVRWHPPLEPLPGAFDFPAYLRTRGIQHVQGAGTGSPSVRWPWRVTVRDWLLERLRRGIDRERARAMLAGLALGDTRDLSRGEREVFAGAGIVHLFAVSGLHVGLLFAALLVILRCLGVPWGWRHALAPVLLVCYVALCGGPESAQRAWLMLALWSWGRALGVPSPGLNALSAAALLVFLHDPLALFRSGVQYSFVLTLVLLLAWRWRRELLDWLQEHERWQPYALRLADRSRRWQRPVLSTAVMLLAAWLGALGLNAWHQGLFLPLSLGMNLVVGLLSWPVLALSLTHLLGQLLPGSPTPLAPLLTGLLEGLADLAGWAARHELTWHLPRPHFAALLAFYAALLAVLLLPRRPAFLAGGLAALTLTVLLLLSPRLLPPSRVSCDLVAWGAPKVVLHPPWRRDSITLNESSSVEPVLRQRGRDGVEIAVAPMYCDGEPTTVWSSTARRCGDRWRPLVDGRLTTSELRYEGGGDDQQRRMVWRGPAGEILEITVSYPYVTWRGHDDRGDFEGRFEVERTAHPQFVELVP